MPSEGGKKAPRYQNISCSLVFVEELCAGSTVTIITTLLFKVSITASRGLRAGFGTAGAPWRGPSPHRGSIPSRLTGFAWQQLYDFQSILRLASDPWEEGTCGKSLG